MEPDETELLVPGAPADAPVEVVGEGLFFNDMRGPYQSPVGEEIEESAEVDEGQIIIHMPELLSEAVEAEVVEIENPEED